jgi:hypothetical protein
MKPCVQTPVLPKKKKRILSPLSAFIIAAFLNVLRNLKKAINFPYGEVPQSQVPSFQQLLK